MSDDDFDLSRFKSKNQDRRSTAEVVATITPPASRPRRRTPFKSKFIQVPTFWREALRGAPGSTFEAALAVLDEKYRRDHIGGEVVLSAEVTGLKKDARRDATKDLIGRSLIEVDQSGRAAPRVVSVSLSS